MRLGNASGTLFCCMPLLEAGRVDLVLSVNDKVSGLGLCAGAIFPGSL